MAINCNERILTVFTIIVYGFTPLRQEVIVQCQGTVHLLIIIVFITESFYVDALHHIDNLIEAKCKSIAKTARWQNKFQVRILIQFINL